jgi:hypothetical protein
MATVVGLITRQVSYIEHIFTAVELLHEGWSPYDILTSVSVVYTRAVQKIRALQ